MYQKSHDGKNIQNFCKAMQGDGDGGREWGFNELRRMQQAVKCA